MMEQTILIQLFMKNISIAQLNDAFRRGDPKIPGKFVMTVGIQSFPEGDIQTIIKKKPNKKSIRQGTPHDIFVVGAGSIMIWWMPLLV